MREHARARADAGIRCRETALSIRRAAELGLCHSLSQAHRHTTAWHGEHAAILRSVPPDPASLSG